MNTTLPPSWPFSELPPSTLETARLRLRAIQSGDGQLMFDLYGGDPTATRYMSFPCATTPVESEAFAALVAKAFACQFSVDPEGTKSAPNACFAWLIQDKATGEYMGSAGFDAKSEDTLGGGYILNQKFWGEGYASEAWQALLDWAKTQAQVKRIEATHHQDNKTSGKVMQRCGVTCEGLVPNQLFPNVSSERVEAVMYAWVRPRQRTPSERD